MNNKRNKYGNALFLWLYVALLLAVVVGFTACREKATPRPTGFFRIEPYPSVSHTDTVGTITFAVNDLAQAVVPRETADGVSWLDIAYPRYGATLYLSYIPIGGGRTIEALMSESRELVYRQHIHTEAVEAIAYEAPEQPLYATLYYLSAASATPIQFVATDSMRYLLRGVLYYDTPVRTDSVAPTLQYLEGEITHLIESITPLSQ